MHLTFLPYNAGACETMHHNGVIPHASRLRRLPSGACLVCERIFVALLAHMILPVAKKP
ncbi:hypothetical protein BN77_p10165 [Rhizobium mesoamericanum STM3625]|uniref:Uncharacterized protein n=1 Tax=Rhizobium mesoamericanum STM3625 TaxID=1211777 RepID=K0PWS5_9HYPH|nr:hypothetical protein BN77_p10165 [Rhizobium mesoamericanum STM3625]